MDPPGSRAYLGPHPEVVPTLETGLRRFAAFGRGMIGAVWLARCVRLYTMEPGLLRGPGTG